MTAVPRMAPDVYARTVFAGRIYPLPGGGGTVELLEDGRGLVRNADGATVGTLDPGTTRQLDPNRADRPPAPARRPSFWARITRGGIDNR